MVLHHTQNIIAIYIVAKNHHILDMEIREDITLVLNIDMWFVQQIHLIVMVGFAIFGIDGENLIEISLCYMKIEPHLGM